MSKIAIIGAGLAGLTTASKLNDYASVTIFEKARGVGGRMATRRAEPFIFDHGAQFFKAKTDRFRAFIAPLIDLGIIQRWDARFVEFDRQKKISQRIWDQHYPHYVAVPGMNALAKYLATKLEVRLTTRVAQIIKNDRNWDLFDDQGKHIDSFDWVISTTPAQQAIDLLPESFKFYSTMQNIQMLGCFALMLGFTHPLDLDFDEALVKNADISCISVNSSKPGRNGLFSVVVHSTNKWAQA
ncbi:MAG: NAD(P)/FAD-dependent oxidoreductase, partial [Burkholderiales bacterium]